MVIQIRRKEIVSKFHVPGLPSASSASPRFRFQVIGSFISIH